MRRLLIIAVYMWIIPVFIYAAKIKPSSNDASTQKHALNEAENFLPAAYGPIGISNDPPIVISKTNDQSYLSNPQIEEREAARNVKILENKIFPFYATLLFLALTTVVFLFRNAFITFWNKIGKTKPLTSAEMALRTIENIDQKVIMDKEAFKEYYTKLTNIVRQYIEDRYQIKAPYYTSEEFLHKVKDKAIFNDSTKKTLADFLKVGDLVKFAYYHPSMDDCQKAKVAAKQFIES